LDVELMGVQDGDIVGLLAHNAELVMKLSPHIHISGIVEDFVNSAGALGLHRIINSNLGCFVVGHCKL